MDKNETWKHWADEGLAKIGEQWQFLDSADQLLEKYLNNQPKKEVSK